MNLFLKNKGAEEQEKDTTRPINIFMPDRRDDDPKVEKDGEPNIFCEGRRYISPSKRPNLFRRV